MPGPQMTLRERRAHRDRVGKIMFASSSLLVGGVFLAAYSIEPVEREANLCIANEPAKAHHIVLVDRTDPFDENFSRQVSEFIIRKAKSIEQDELLEIFTIQGEHLKKFPPRISLCSPGRGTDYNKLFHNQKKKEADYQEKYLDRFKETAESLAVSTDAPKSPILEIIHDITTRRQRPEVNGSKTIILISDMAQNSDLLRFVDGRNPTEVTDAHIRDAIREIAGVNGLQFQGFSFEIHQVEYVYNRQVTDHVKKPWENIIRDNGGNLATWEDL